MFKHPLHPPPYPQQLSPYMLERYTWRHNSVLKYMAKTLSDLNSPENKVYADIPGWMINNSTIPQHIITSSQQPEL